MDGSAQIKMVSIVLQSFVELPMHINDAMDSGLVARTLNFKDAAAPRFGHSDMVLFYF